MTRFNSTALNLHHRACRLAALLAAFVFAISLAGCGDASSSNAAADENTLERIQRTGTVRLAYANEAPFGYQNLETGEVTGESPEIARVILERIGATDVEATLVDWGQLIPGLKAGRYDIVAAGMYITPARGEQVDFSNPTYAIGEGLLVAEDNPHNITSYTDIKSSDDVVLGVVGGTVEIDIARDIGIPDARIRIVPDNATAVQAIKAGRIDVFGGTALTVKDLAGKHDGVAEVQDMTQPQLETYSMNYGGFAFRQTDDALREAFNKELASFIGSDEHLELIAPFGFDESNLPGDVTADDLVNGSGDEAQDGGA